MVNSPESCDRGSLSGRPMHGPQAHLRLGTLEKESGSYPVAVRRIVRRARHSRRTPTLEDGPGRYLIHHPQEHGQRLAPAVTVGTVETGSAPRTIPQKSSPSRLAPPTRAPSTSGSESSSAAFPGLTEPP